MSLNDAHTLEFKCQACSHPIAFSVLDAAKMSATITCPSCEKSYAFGSQILEHLKKFEALCQQIQDSKEIFGQAAIAIDVGSHHVKIPFQLLLTRLSSVLELDIGGEKTTIAFRVDTSKETSLSKILGQTSTQAS